MNRLGIAFTIAASGCAQAPTAELELATARVEAARVAEAEVFAAAPFARAETALDSAYALADRGGFLDAIHAAGEAVTHADVAFAEAIMAKRVAERDVHRCLGELEGLLAIAAARGASEDELAAYDERYRAVRAVADSGDLLGALDQGSRLKPELLLFEQRFR